VALPPGIRSIAFAAVGACVAGLLTGVVTPTSAIAGTASTQHRLHSRVPSRVHSRLHGPDTVYRHHSVHVPRTFFGLHDGSEQAYGHLPFGSLRLWDAGVTWADVETSPGVYDWSRLDSLVSAAQAHHVQVTLVLAMTPSFYASSPSLPPSDLGAFSRYVTAVMSRYRDFQGRRGITAYQVWNEGNVPTFWTGTPEQLAQLTQVVDQVRDQVDPRATVVAPSFAVRLPYQRRWMSSYQRQLVDGRHVWHYYDVNAVSLYPKPSYGHRLGGPEDAMRLLGYVRRDLHRDGVPRRTRIWATEVNYGVTGGGVGRTAARHISQRRQVANVLRTYLLAAAEGVSRVFWYRYDWGRLATGGTLGNTLLSDPTDFSRIRAAGLAMRTAERWLRGRLVGTHGRRPCARGRRGTYACTVRFRGGVRTIYWNPRHRVRIEVPRHGGARVVVLGRSGGRVARRHVARRTVRVSFRPVMVRTSH
jgi:hypothetical protein